MFDHKCKIEKMKILGERCNPLDERWNAWTLMICPSCKTIQEWQHHSEEEMHGTDLHITALPTPDYLRHKYNLSELDVQAIINGKKKAVCYDRYKKQYYEEEA